MSSFAIFLLSLLIFLLRVTTSDPTEENGELNPFVEDTDGEQLPFVKDIQNERNALLSFLRNVIHDPSKIQWKESEHHCTHWKGVYCDPRKTTVVQLSLPYMSLVGKIPDGTIGNLSNLLYLSLRGNGFRGRIPSDFFGLALSELYLNDNNFTGGLENINADHLEKLNVSNNALSCSIPTLLSKFPQSSFSGIKNLCGRPLRPCNRTTFVCLEPYIPRNTDNNNNKKRVTVGLLAGFGIFVILLSSVPKRIYKWINQPTKLALGARITNLLWFDDRFNCYNCDKLLRASAEVLGKGSVGTSYKRVLEETKMTVVLKRLKDVTVPVTDFESHMEVLRKMKNENVVPLKGYCYSKDTKWLVYDYMPSGSLSAHLHESIPLDWDRRMRIALSAARGVAYLHLGNIVHGNIKSSNVLLREESNEDAVSDYGLHTLFDMLSSPNHWVTGYRAPEVINTKIFTFESDVYSFGVLLVEILTGKAPNQALEDELQLDFSPWVQWVVHQEQKVEIVDDKLRKDQNVEPMFQMLRIAKDCVSVEPDKRPRMQEVVSMLEEISRVEINI